LNFSNLSRLKAIKSASSLLLGAGSHVEGGNEALRIVDGAIFLTHAHILRLSNIISNGD
jgi:hypothetical protein